VPAGASDLISRLAGLLRFMGMATQVANRPDIRDRIDALDWARLGDELDTQGFAITHPVLSVRQCRELAALFDLDRFRSTIDMARHRFGEGRYRYFSHPLPGPIAAARAGFYERLSPIANRWAGLLSGDNPTFPAGHDELLARCRAAGQTRPTPLLLRYRPGDWNALHQDLYGDVYFPFQVLTVLSQAGTDYTGGEFVLLEQRPRAQSRAHVLTPPQGAFVIFPTRERPNPGRHGYHRVALRHGVSTVTSGERTALGIIFHDSK
jgi:hypothetical protein